VDTSAIYADCPALHFQRSIDRPLVGHDGVPEDGMGFSSLSRIHGRDFSSPLFMAPYATLDPNQMNPLVPPSWGTQTAFEALSANEIPRSSLTFLMSLGMGRFGPVSVK